MNSNNPIDPDSTALLLKELAQNEEKELTIEDANKILTRMNNCDNGDGLRKLLVNPENIQSLGERILFVAGGLPNGFEKSVEIVTAAIVTNSRSHWTEEHKKALRVEMKRIDREYGSRLEEGDTWAGSNDPQQSSTDPNPQDIDAAERKTIRYEYEERKQNVKDDIL